MRLQKQLNRVVADKEYAKYLLVIPPETVEKLAWKEGEELEHEIRDRTLLVQPLGFKARPASAKAIGLIRKHSKSDK
jgi:bifunctional DNA-binding transcriptional regulator/antitoxin component of YhaV-PrlF toxin-antitoxin module